MKLYLILPDIHDKHPSYCSLKQKAYHPAVKCVEDIMKKYQPHGVMYLGDTTDMESLSSFDRDKRQIMEGKRYIKDINSVNHLLDRHQSISNKTKEWIYIIGNHETRVKTYVEYHPEVEGQFDYVKNTRLIERGFEVIQANCTKKLGKALFMHGFDDSKNHAANMSRTYPKTIYYGHVHDVQMHSFVSPIDMKEVRVAASLGCLCDLNPGWMRNRPNKWVHSFGMFWLSDNGSFQMDIKFIINGKTIVNGETFG